MPPYNVCFPAVHQLPRDCAKVLGVGRYFACLCDRQLARPGGLRAASNQLESLSPRESHGSWPGLEAGAAPHDQQREDLGHSCRAPKSQFATTAEPHWFNRSNGQNNTDSSTSSVNLLHDRMKELQANRS